MRRSCQASGADPEGSSTAATTEASAQSQTVTEPSSQPSPSPSARTPRSPGGYRSAEGTTLDMRDSLEQTLRSVVEQSASNATGASWVGGVERTLRRTQRGLPNVTLPEASTILAEQDVVPEETQGSYVSEDFQSVDIPAEPRKTSDSARPNGVASHQQYLAVPTSLADRISSHISPRDTFRDTERFSPSSRSGKDSWAESQAPPLSPSAQHANLGAQPGAFSPSPLDSWAPSPERRRLERLPERRPATAGPDARRPTALAEARLRSKQEKQSAKRDEFDARIWARLGELSLDVTQVGEERRPTTS